MEAASLDLCTQLPVSNTIATVSPFLVCMVYDVYGSYTPAFLAIAALSALKALLLFFAKPPVRSALAVLRPKVAES
jgi:cyanate permease